MVDPQDPFTTPMVEAAISLHELFVNLQTAGFTEEQALSLVALLIERSTQ